MPFLFHHSTDKFRFFLENIEDRILVVILIVQEKLNHKILCFGYKSSKLENCENKTAPRRSNTFSILMLLAIFVFFGDVDAWIILSLTKGSCRDLDNYF